MKYIITFFCLLSCATAFSVLTKNQFIKKYNDAKVIEKNNTKVTFEYESIDNKISIKSIDTASMSEELKVYLGIDTHKSIDISSIGEEDLVTSLGIDKNKYSASKKKKLKQLVNKQNNSTQKMLKPIAGQISGKINDLLSTGITVIPTDTGQFMIIDERPFFEIEKTKKKWLTVVVASVGSVLNKNKKIKVNEIYMADSLYANELKKALMIKAKDCMRLQSMISSYEIDIDQFYSSILKSVKEVTF